tara:strand:+ start:105 stop:1034 length:930 start_codon:yes stop_codon:yes gene_type:complete
MGKSRLQSRRKQDQGLKWARIVIGILSTIGVIDTGSITIKKWGWLGDLTCPGGSNGCDEVLNSAWGTIFQGNSFSIPLSLIGFLGYLSILLFAVIPLTANFSDSKINLLRKSWWGLFIVSLGMSIFSLILIGIMIFKIKAFCFFCILSALISFIILILTILGGKWDDPSELIFRGILVSLVVILGGFIWSSSVDPNKIQSDSSAQGVPPLVKSKSSQKQINLARHLTKQGAVMYNAYWCPHCHDQKELFGKEAVLELKLIECAKDGKNNQKELCDTKGISGFPSWELNGTIESGIKSLKELAEISGYKD